MKVAEHSAVDEMLGLTRLLALEIGPRRPCSQAEHAAAEAIRDWLAERRIEARLQPFRGYASFGYPFGAILGVALAGGLLQKRRPLLGTSIVAASIAAAALEQDLRRTPISDLFSTRDSANVVATIRPTDRVRQRVVLCGHMDSTRSGLMFHPAAIGHLPTFIRLPGMGSALLATWPLIRRLPGGGLLRRAAIGALASSLALLVERELRGVDVPGANDNASGTAIACQLAAEVASAPLRHTQVDVLVTGCEEAGMLGSQAYMRELERTRSAGDPPVLFLNFDSVGGDVPLTFILREGTATMRDASPRLIGMLEEIADKRPDLTLQAAAATAGLPTDATPALARGYDAVTLLAQSDDGIPNYHWPTDTLGNISPEALDRALETGRELLRALEGQAGSA